MLDSTLISSNHFQICGIELIVGIILLAGYLIWRHNHDKQKR